MQSSLMFLAIRISTAVEPICCSIHWSSDVVNHGNTDAGEQRYKCRNRGSRHGFVLKYSYRGYLADVKEQIVNMAVNGSVMRDTVRGLKISPTTVIEEIKNQVLMQVNQPLIEQLGST